VKHIALLGYGALARDVVAGLLSGQQHTVSVFLRPGSPSATKLPNGTTRLSSLAALIAAKPDMVVEAAGHDAVQELASPCLEAGIPVLVTSVGALHDASLYAKLVAATNVGKARLVLPSGALGGLDYVRAAGNAPDLALGYTSTKPPAAWSAELQRMGHDPARLAGPVTLFEGNAREAAACYPQNLNVAAALALSGQGFEATHVRIVCNPAAKGNTHAIQAESAFGTLRLEIINTPSATNPKTSWIVSQSVLAAIRQFFSPVQIL
jgi:aspartate dehydrogenase